MCREGEEIDRRAPAADAGRGRYQFGHQGNVFEESEEEASVEPRRFVGYDSIRLLTELSEACILSATMIDLFLLTRIRERDGLHIEND